MFTYQGERYLLTTKTNEVLKAIRPYGEESIKILTRNEKGEITLVTRKCKWLHRSLSKSKVFNQMEVVK